MNRNASDSYSSGVVRPTRADVAARPQLCEIRLIIGTQLGRRDSDDVILLQLPGIFGPVGRAGPNGMSVADRVLVVHQLRHVGIAAGNRLGRDGGAEPPDEIRGARRSRVGAGRGEVGVRFTGVICNSNVNPSRRPFAQRPHDRFGNGIAQTKIVNGEV